jgi:hypothetical protein
LHDRMISFSDLSEESRIDLLHDRMISFSDLSEESRIDLLRAFVQQEGLDVKDTTKAGLYSKICERFKVGGEDASPSKPQDALNASTDTIKSSANTPQKSEPGTRTRLAALSDKAYHRLCAELAPAIRSGCSRVDLLREQGLHPGGEFKGNFTGKLVKELFRPVDASDELFAKMVRAPNAACYNLELALLR